MATLQEIIDRAQAAAGGYDADISLEAMLWPLIRDLYGEKAGNVDERWKVLKTHPLSLSNGFATLPSTVMTKFMSSAVVSDSTDETTADLMSWKANWQDYVSNLSSMLGYFTLHPDGKFYARLPGVTYTDSLSASPVLNVTTASMPDVPADEDDEMDINSELVDEIVMRLAAAIRPAPAPSS